MKKINPFILKPVDFFMQIMNKSYKNATSKTRDKKITDSYPVCITALPYTLGFVSDSSMFFQQGPSIYNASATAPFLFKVLLTNRSLCNTILIF